ncbi:MAG: hypothetical protein WD004_01440, partial [Actinomycetota bacterium]
MSLNQYAYGGGNPVTMSDQTGMAYTHAQWEKDMAAYSAAVVAWQAYDASYAAAMGEYLGDMAAWSYHQSQLKTHPGMKQWPMPVFHAPPTPSMPRPGNPPEEPPEDPPVEVKLKETLSAPVPHASPGIPPPIPGTGDYYNFYNQRPLAYKDEVVSAAREFHVKPKGELTRSRGHGSVYAGASS